MVESAGWDGIYLADTQNLAADVHVSLGIMATATERLRLVTGVTNPVTRHPAVTATAIATVHAASAGRASGRATAQGPVQESGHHTPGRSLDPSASHPPLHREVASGARATRLAVPHRGGQTVPFSRFGNRP